MILIPYIFSTIIGYCFISLLFQNWRPFSSSLHIALSIGFGLGLSALINFITFLLFGEYNRFAILSFNLATLIFLMTFNILKSNQKPYSDEKIKSKMPLPMILFCFSAAVLFIALICIANTHPYGEWDAWALWNMKLKFLLFSGKEWSNIFTQLHWSTQPDYPLLLVFLNMTPFAFFNNYLIQIPMTTAVCLTFTTGFILFSGLKKISNTWIALFAFILLMANAFFLFQSTSQYSDVLLGLYILSSLVCISSFFEYKHPGFAALLGIFLGLMTFTKNEGIVIAFLLSTLFLIQIYFANSSLSSNKKTILKIFLSFLLVFCLVTIYFKIFLAPRNRDILINVSNTQLNFFNWNGFVTIMHKFQEEFFHLHWSYLWIFCGILILLGISRIFHPKCKIFTLFFILYLLVLIYIYLTTTNFDLNWRLDNTLARILTYLLPSVLYYSFVLNFHPERP